jgi:hypothetical protein
MGIRKINWHLSEAQYSTRELKINFKHVSATHDRYFDNYKGPEIIIF